MTDGGRPALAGVAGPARYELVRQLGAGGMGVVYEARDRARGVRVAIKTLQHATAEGLLRLKSEFRALADLAHPNLVRFDELLEEGGRWFIVMELIEGVDVLEWVRPDALDEARLRTALAQLASGLVALHAAGKVHRDVKPSNVLVARDGRVVLLDLGLATAVSGPHLSQTGHVVGTAAYMAPEQAASARVGPEADWYCVGALLYEALTARMPFEGAPLEVLLKKQREEAPRVVEAGVPADLVELCAALLGRDPAGRPRGHEVLTRLGVPMGSQGTTQSASTGRESTFVGREAELAVLGGALGRMRKGECVKVVVHGESGIGKSRLVERLVEKAEREVPELLVLAGRCYERETVPYKAFDGVLDALSRVLIGWSDADAAQILPRQAAHLAQVFPVLARVRVFGRARPAEVMVDVQERRSRLLAAVRELFARLSDVRPLVVVIDDLQWADHDSLTLLAELVREPEPPRLLLLATSRVPVAELYRGPGELLRPRGLEELVVERLPEADARALAERLLAGAVRAAEIGREAGGHPLFIEELARHASVDVGGDAVLRLDDALRARAAALDVDARALLELVAVAGVRTGNEVLQRASGLEPLAFDRALGALRAGRLVRSAGNASSAAIEPYHDRVREAVAGGAGAGELAARHRALAEALEGAPDRDVDRLAVHWHGAGELERAATCAVAAAERAETMLAFDRAAGRYREALEWGISGAGDVTLRLGNALALAGRGEEAAEAYLRLAEGQSGARAERLKRDAGIQLLRCGRFDRGMRIIGEVLASHDIRWPRTQGWSLLLALWLWMRLIMRGLRIRQKPSAREWELARVDLCFEGYLAVVNADTVLSLVLHFRGVLLALRAADPARIARVLAINSGLVPAFTGHLGSRSTREMDLASRLASESGDQISSALVFCGEASRHFAVGSLLNVRPGIEQGMRLLARVPGAACETVAFGRFWTVQILYSLGLLRDAAREVLSGLGDAIDRGDTYGIVMMQSGVATLAAWLPCDEPQTAAATASEAIRRWGRTAFDLQHFQRLLAVTNVSIYSATPAVAAIELKRARPGLRSARIALVKFLGVQLLDVMGRTSLALAESAKGEDRSRQLREVQRVSRKLSRVAYQTAPALSLLLQAGAAHVDRRPDVAVLSLRNAMSAFDVRGMAMHAACARSRLAALVKGTEGEELRAKAQVWLDAQRIKNPSRFIAMIAPGFDGRD